jgi:hypothetical protein
VIDGQKEMKNIKKIHSAIVSESFYFNSKHFHDWDQMQLLA